MCGMDISDVCEVKMFADAGSGEGGDGAGDIAPTRICGVSLDALVGRHTA